jgi:glycerophosphoryl diester phosphodiesterase
VKIPIERLKDLVLKTADGIMSLVPQPEPSLQKRHACRLIAHRGGHGGNPHLENTLAAFRTAKDVGAWGIEFDVRWTADDIAVIHHDSSTQRGFGVDLEIEQTSFEHLRKVAPLIPTLTEVIEEFGHKAHLMIEVKRANRTLNRTRLDTLELALKGLRAHEEYHLMSLSPDLLLACEFAPKNALLPVAEFDVASVSALALRENFAGMTSQYLLMAPDLIRKHRDRGQAVGTGFAASTAVLHREINRDIDWVFTNHIAERARDLNL